MRNFFSDLSYKFSVFMQGSYGRDELSRAITIAAIGGVVLSTFRPLHFFVYIALAILIWSAYRSFSKNRTARERELEAYRKIKDTIVNKFKLIKSMWRDRNTHIYVKCPNCRTYVRISKPPKGKRIRITCPKCRNTIEKNT